MIKVEVAYALPTEQKILSVQVEEDASAYDAVIRSGIVQLFPEIDPDTIPMGIFAKAITAPKSTSLKEGDRIELYRPLIADPKEARAKRAAKMKAEKTKEEASSK